MISVDNSAAASGSAALPLISPSSHCYQHRQVNHKRWRGKDVFDSTRSQCIRISTACTNSGLDQADDYAATSICAPYGTLSPVMGSLVSSPSTSAFSTYHERSLLGSISNSVKPLPKKRKGLLVRYSISKSSARMSLSRRWKRCALPPNNAVTLPSTRFRLYQLLQPPLHTSVLCTWSV